MQAREGAAVGSEKMRLAPDRENGAEQAAAPHPRPARAPVSALSPEVAGERGTVPARCRSTSVILPKVSSGDQRARSPATRSRVSRILRSPGKAGWESGVHLAAIRLLYEYAHERPRAFGASQAPAASAERRSLPLLPRPQRGSAQSRGRVGGGLSAAAYCPQPIGYLAIRHPPLPNLSTPANPVPYSPSFRFIEGVLRRRSGAEAE